LLSQGYLVSDPQDHGGLRFGEAALVRPLLRGEAQLALRLPPPSRERRQAAQGDRPVTTPLQELPAEAQQRFEALRRWRLEQARDQGVPPYVVFHDRTLVEIAARCPTDLGELGQVSGVGAAKLERYGAAVLAVLGPGTPLA
jgi:ATP-dependent DNA helicase RecQ